MIDWHDIQLTDDTFIICLEEVEEEFREHLERWDNFNMVGVKGEFELNIRKEIFSYNNDIPYAQEMGEYWKSYIEDQVGYQLDDLDDMDEIEEEKAFQETNPHLEFLQKFQEDGWERVYIW